MTDAHEALATILLMKRCRQRSASTRLHALTIMACAEANITFRLMMAMLTPMF
jgi:hypothetical protein